MYSTVAGHPSEKLVELYQNDPALREEAYGILCERYDPIVFKRIRKHLFFKGYLGLSYVEIKEEARGLAQEFLVEKFRKVIEKYDPEKGELNKWINKCVRNFVISFLRGQPEEIESFQIEEEGALYVAKKVLELDSPYVQRDRQDVQRIMNGIISSLSKIDQYVIDLHYRQDKSAEEIASILKVKPGTINSRLSRIRKRILKRLKQQGLDEEVR